MKNLDTLKESKKEILQKMTDAVKNDNSENFTAAFDELMDITRDAVLLEANGLVDSNNDAILAARGVRCLTSEEKGFYEKFIEAAKSPVPQQALSNLDVTLPKTVIDSVFEDIQEAHPLLNAINFLNTEALTEMYVSTTSGSAVWGELTAKIAGEISASFAKVDLKKAKLTAYMLVPKSMLDLGPAWLDRYVRTILIEAIAVGLEAAVVDGDGKDKMLGMTRKLSGDTGGVFPRKTAVAITSFDPTTYGGLLNTLSKGPNEKRRAISEVIMVVNPSDYFTKVFPASTVRTTDGGFNFNVFPFPTKVYQSPSVPEDHAVLGIAKKYFAGLGTSKGGRLEYDDSVKFMEDQRAYAIRLYGDGRALDESAFVYIDISKLKPYVQEVKVNGTATTA